jgi:hypothetical protein
LEELCYLGFIFPISCVLHRHLYIVDQVNGFCLSYSLPVEIFSLLMKDSVEARVRCYFSLHYRSVLKWAFSAPLLEWAFSCSLLLLNLIGANWGRVEIQKRHMIDWQTESGIRCVRAQVETRNLHCFFSLSIFFKALFLYNSLKPCL